MRQKLINILIIDKYFNIYTRNGFEYMIKDYGEYKIFLVDFDNIRGMNKELGYIKVNEIFKKTFSKLKKYYIIGRAFSGDEIFFLTDDIDDNIDLIQNVCYRNNLTFAYTEEIHKHREHQYFGENAGGIKFQYISETLERMIEKFH